MSGLQFSVRAPSNIALIKYMGKKDASLNLPENGSISMTLHSLCSVAEISITESPLQGKATFSDRVRWVSERPQGFLDLPLQVPALDEKGISKLIRHAERVGRAASSIFPRFGLELGGLAAPDSQMTWNFRTANTFPQASGIASSASSFAAITVVTALACAKDRQAFEKLWSSNSTFREELAQVSRLGSGSSCRSLDGPWVMWEGERVTALSSKMPEMAHFVLLVSDEQKKVSSSEAHLRVKTSPLWEKRPERVAQRLAAMRSALALGDLRSVAQIAWAESWEMHSLFHTSEEPFSYWQPGTISALQELSKFVSSSNPPIVTLDAGPNIHVIVEAHRREEWFVRLSALGRVLSDRPGMGAGF